MYGNISTNNTISNLFWRLHPQSRLAKGGGFEDSEAGGDLIRAIQPQSLAESCGTEHGT